MSLSVPWKVAPAEGESIDRFIVKSVLGEGTFGTVYKVTDENGKIFALKLLRLYDLYPINARSYIAQRFDLEFETAKILSPGLVESYEKGVIKGNPYFTMYYCSNGSLGKKAGTSVNETYANKIALDILTGLKHLHQNGKIHRDLKPQNILIDEQGRARLTDFGIAGHLNLDVRLTSTDFLGHPKERFGSYPYMPPEQIKPTNRVVTKLPANDIFSFGVTMFELLTGSLPFGKISGEADLADYIARVHKGRWKLLSDYRKDLSPVWQKIMEGCLQPDYRKRFSNVQEIIEILGNVEKDSFIPIISHRLSLLVMQGEEHNKNYMIGELLKERNSGLLTIGRRDGGVNNHIMIKDDNLCYISRHHATIEKHAPDKWYIRDGQWINITGNSSWVRSKNGTYVNGVEVSDAGVELKINDVITMGDTTLKVLNK
ncbi:MAG: protein kinase domain-containing protein [Bacteroidota bacterium]